MTNQTKPEPELLPCPFCGSKAHKYMVEERDNYGTPAPVTDKAKRDALNWFLLYMQDDKQRFGPAVTEILKTIRAALEGKN